MYWGSHFNGTRIASIVETWYYVKNAFHCFYAEFYDISLMTMAFTHSGDARDSGDSVHMTCPKKTGGLGVVATIIFQKWATETISFSHKICNINLIYIKIKVNQL